MNMANQEDHQTDQEKANIAFTLAEAEKSRAHARLMNAQAEGLEKSNQNK